MIVIFNFDYKYLDTFNDFDEVASFILTLENMKLPQGNLKAGHPKWGFEYYTPAKVRHLYENMPALPCRQMLKEAFEQELGAFEIWTGHYHNPLFIPFTPDIDGEGLKRRWCFAYCQAYHYFLVETVDVVPVQSPPFIGEAHREACHSFRFLEGFPNRKNPGPLYPFNLFIRLPFPLPRQEIARLAQRWATNCQHQDSNQDDNREFPL